MIGIYGIYVSEYDKKSWKTYLKSLKTVDKKYNWKTNAYLLVFDDIWVDDSDMMWIRKNGMIYLIRSLPHLVEAESLWQLKKQMQLELISSHL